MSPTVPAGDLMPGIMQFSPALAAVYVLGKYDQERMCLTIGRACNIPPVALRLFNVYGRRQAFSNPYTGVLAIYASQLLNRDGLAEDGIH